MMEGNYANHYTTNAKGMMEFVITILELNTYFIEYWWDAVLLFSMKTLYAMVSLLIKRNLR